MRILIIEDEAMIRVNLQEMLKIEGFIVEVAGNVSEGIQKTEAYAPDAILCDWSLPDGTGEEVMQAFPKIPLVIMSARPSSFFSAECLASAAGYISKPFLLDFILATLWRIRDRRPPASSRAFSFM